MGASWNQKPARLACRPHADRAHAPRLSIPTSGRFAVGNNTTLVAVVAAGVGSVALLLAVGIVVILRNRRAARAVDAAPVLRAPFLGE
jgi:hypothetical protein